MNAIESHLARIAGLAGKFNKPISAALRTVPIHRSGATRAGESVLDLLRTVQAGHLRVAVEHLTQLNDAIHQDGNSVSKDSAHEPIEVEYEIVSDSSASSDTPPEEAGSGA